MRGRAQRGGASGAGVGSGPSPFRNAFRTCRVVLGDPRQLERTACHTRTLRERIDKLQQADVIVDSQARVARRAVARGGRAGAVAWSVVWWSHGSRMVATRAITRRLTRRPHASQAPLSTHVTAM